MTIKEAQDTVDQWIKTYGVRYFSELTNMAVLTEEVGELARVMARKYGDQSFKAGEKDNLGDEMKRKPLEIRKDIYKTKNSNLILTKKLVLWKN